MLLVALLALGASAPAAGPEVWAALHDARLSESADRDPGAAIAIYETVLHHLGDGDDLRGELLLQLARARFSEGDLAGARAALVEAAGDPTVGPRARAWRVQVDAFERRVQSLPFETAFVGGVGPLVLGWSASTDASLQVTREGAMWTTVVREGRDDYLLAAISEGAGPLRRVELELEPLDITTHLRLIVEDDGGARWTAPAVEILPGDSTRLDVAVADLLAVGGGSEQVDPERIRVIMLQDVTAFHSADRGSNRIRVPRLGLR